MNKFKLLVILFLFSVCITAFAVGCGSSSGTVIGKLPIDSNMPIQNGGHDNSGSKPEPPSADADDTDDTDETPEPVPDAKPEPPEETVENVVVFTADGFEFTVPYSAGEISVTEPPVPEKLGHVGKWQSYDLSGGVITVTAEYEIIRYAVMFTADETAVTRHYTIFDVTVEAPKIPQKKGYSSEWEAFELTYGEALTVNAIYSILFYKICFPLSGGMTERTYTVLNRIIDEPEVPHKAGYTGEWRYGELTFDEDMVAEAVYSPLAYTADDSFKWARNDGGDGYSVTKYVGADSEVIIPPFYNGLPVTEIGKTAFMDCEGLYAVIISENVQKICNNAFIYCTELTDVELPSTLIEIGANAFSYSGISHINLPENLVKIDRQAFSYTKLTSIVMPDSLEELGEFAFTGCELLKSADTGNGLKIIPEQTFANCTALKTVEIGLNVAQICKNAFKNCASLDNAVFRDKNNWCARMGTPFIDTCFSEREMSDAAWIANVLTTATDAEFIKN